MATRALRARTTATEMTVLKEVWLERRMRADRTLTIEQTDDLMNMILHFTYFRQRGKSEL